MLAARIYSDPWEVDERLRTVFDASRDEFIRIAKEVVGARADVGEDDPLTAAGQFAYIHGTRNVRSLFRSKGWINFRHENIESVRHPGRDLKVIYQSVDLATSIEHEPRPVSGKGSGTERLLDEACASLFSVEQLNALAGRHVGGNTTGAWYYCVSVNGDDVRSELSLPAGISGGNFTRFIERIFILNGGDWVKLVVEGEAGSDAVDYEPVVTRK